MNFCLLSLEAFDGRFDLVVHTTTFLAQISLYGTLDNLMCWAFLTIPRGSMREWYNRLKPLSISFFMQLTKEFELHFINDIARVRQREDESLSNFITCFADEIDGM